MLLHNVKKPISNVIQTAIELLERNSYSVNLSLHSGNEAFSIAAEHGVKLSIKPESFAISVLADKTVLLMGSDDTGLLYAAYELIGFLKANGGNIDALHSISEEPFTKIRGLYRFVHNADVEKDWFYSKEYWLWWFNQMAESRYNSYNLVFSHQTYYLAPMFAYFLEMPEFPDVFPDDTTLEDIKRNHEMLQFISKTATDYGITFIIGIWQMCAWKGNENDWRPTQPGTVRGLTSENLQEYIYAGMSKLVKQFPYIEGLQIRANEESGIPRDKQVAFYKESLFKAMSEADRPFVFDFRCWLAEEETIQNAIDMISGTRMSVKYWGEFMGAPYQPAKINPGYSYSDYLRLPLKTDFIYQVWSLGSPRLFVWGDPDYVRRFVYSTTLGGAHGFEINPQLAQKGYGNEPGDWRIFADSDSEYFIWEDERYWLFLLLFGRLSYNPNVSSDAWMIPMRSRFGDKADKVMAAVKAGSATLPYLVQASLSDYNMYVWPEIDFGGLLDFYMQTPTSDSCVIDTIPQYVNRWLSGEPSGLFSPYDSSSHFRKIAEDTFLALRDLEHDLAGWLTCGNKSSAKKELAATIIDIKASAFLALYHSHKIMAALNLKFYYETKDRQVLRLSLDELRKARNCWEQLISLTESHYNNHMVTGPTDAGSWKTKLMMIYEDELRVIEIMRLSEKFGNFYKAFDFGGTLKPPPYPIHNDFPVYKDYSVERGFTLVSNEMSYDSEVGYGWIGGLDSVEAAQMPLIRLMDSHMDKLRRDTFFEFPIDKMKGWRNSLTEDGLFSKVPAKLQVDLPDGAYMVSLIICDETAQSKSHGPMSIKIGNISYDDILIPPLQEKIISAKVHIKSEPMIVVFTGNWFISGLVIYCDKPSIASLPRPVINSRNNIISATITAPEGINSVELILDGKAYPMCYIRPDEYEVDINSVMNDCADGSYSVRAVDNDGNVSESDIVSFQYQMKESHFSIFHEPVCCAPLNEDITIVVKVDSANPLRIVNLCYSAVNQLIPVTKVPMVFDGTDWCCAIPGGSFDSMWDILYYFEVVDIYNSGVIYPDFRKQTPYHVIKMLR